MDKRFKRPLCLALITVLIGAATFLADAHKLDLPVTNVAGHDYYYYDVTEGENLYRIGRKLSIPVDDIMRYNPAAQDGVKAGQRLYFPTEDFVQNTARTHVVAKDESIYGIARRYDVTVDDLYAVNVDARDGIRPGMVLTIPADTTPDTTEAEKPESPAESQVDKPERPESSAPVAEATAAPEAAADTIAAEPQAPAEPQYVTRVIGQGETLYRIATDNGLSVEELLAVNPDIDIVTYGAGDTLRIPVAEASMRAERRLNSSKGESPVNIVIMQPFMLNDPSPERQAQHVTDFYRGFLLAADSLKYSGRKVNITVIDTEGSTERVRELVATPALLGADMIVMPDNDEQMAVIAEACADRSLLYNASSVKNELHRDTEGVIQANIPHDPMYAKAIDAFKSLYDGYTTVFLRRNGGATDKEEFVTELRSALEADGRVCIDLTFDSALITDDMSALVETSNYVVVPLSGHRDEFTRFAPALKSYRENLDDASRLRIFGYPDWVILRGSNQETLGDLDVTIYSRFYADPSASETRDLERRYNTAYGRQWIDSAPNQAISGFDTGMFLLRLLRDNDGDITDPHLNYDGIQQAFRLSDDGTQGYYNDALYLINFKPGGLVIKSVM